MAELKDLIVNGTAKFNGRLESIEPISGSMSLYPSFVATIDSSNNRYIHIGSVNIDAEVTASMTCKIAFFESYTENIDTEIIINAKHAAGNGWSQKSVNVSNAAYVDDFYIIETSSTELQLWAKLAVSDNLYVEIYRIYGSTFNLNTKNNVYATLPDNTKTSGSNNDQLNVAYGTCNTASNVASKAVVVSDECWNMRIGSLITIKFINTNTASNPTLNINNTGAYPVIYNTSEITTSQLTYAGSAGKYIAYVFTGRAFVFIGWSVDSNTVYDSATESKAGLMSAEDKKKLNGIASSANTVKYSSVVTKGVKIGTITINGTPIDIYAPEDKVYSSMNGASASKAGSAGLVPAPSAGDQNKFLKADGTWGVPSNTTYSDATISKSGLMSSSDKKKLDGITTMTGALDGVDGSAGLVPAPSAGDQNKFLKADGTWGTPTDTKYSEATTSKAGLMSAADKTKLDDIEKGANNTNVDDTLSETSKNPLQNDVTTKALNNKADKTHKHKVSDITDFPESLPASDVSEWAKAATKPTYSASEVGADAAGSAAKALADAKAYTDGEIADIINGAPTTLDTLGEIANAMEENADVVDALDKAIGKKANTDDLTSHTNNTANPHNVTKNQVGLGNVPNVATNDQTPTYSDATSLATLTSGEKLSIAFGKIKIAISNLISHISNKNNPHTVTKTQIGLGNVENKSSETIRSEITSENIVDALGYTPPTTNTTYGVATSSTLGLVKSGTDITVDSSGNVSVNDDSHNHVISNVDGLQSALDGKAVISHTHDDRYYTESEVDTKLNGKANTSHTHSYLPLSGGTLTGDVVLPITKSSVDASLPVAGATMSITDITSLSNYKTYLGSYNHSGGWFNLISTRHRNGSGNGSSYGMYLRSTLTSIGNLTWGKQYAKSSWQAERTILDSSNYTSYTVTKTGSGASGTWGINVTGSSASCTGNASTASRTVDGGTHAETASGTDANAPTTGMLFSSGLFMTQTYNDAATPVSYGNIINLAGVGTGQLLCEWSGKDNTLGHLYYRSHRDTSTGGWSSWGKVAFTTDTVSAATKATQDSAGQQINTTYIKGLSISGKTITYTKGDGTTGTITTQDTNTWRGVQDNLTSTATDQSLSANQGKVLKGLIDGKAATSHTHRKADITDFPNSLPANGGNADTVNRHTVNSDVPANAKFTDTTYSNATTSAAGLMSAADKAKLDSLSGSGDEDFSKYYQPFSDLFRLM